MCLLCDFLRYSDIFCWKTRKNVSSLISICWFQRTFENWNDEFRPEICHSKIFSYNIIFKTDFSTMFYYISNWMEIVLKINANFLCISALFFGTIMMENKLIFYLLKFYFEKKKKTIIKNIHMSEVFFSLFGFYTHIHLFVLN